MSNLSEAISEMRTMRESYDQIGAAAEAYNVGKTQLAAAITSKGVETSPTETYPEMAEKVAAITQETYEINGGEMYAKQLFGSLETPNYWNLYDILAQLLSDGRLVSYGGILLAEYYKGYDSLALSGAGAGGAYVVSDLDENGQFKMYTEDITHVWDTEFDGKGNRWVAYCFADAGHDFEITNTNTSPRSIHIGRSVGTVTCLADTRISEIIVNDNSTLKAFVSSNHTGNWSPITVIKNISKQNGLLLYKPENIAKAYIEIDTADGCALITMNNGGNNNPNNTFSSLIAKIRKCENGVALFKSLGQFALLNALTTVVISGVEECSGRFSIEGVVGNDAIDDKFISLKKIIITETEELNLYLYPSGSAGIPNLESIYFGYKTNNKLKSISVTGSVWSRFSLLNDIELQGGWCKPIDISIANLLTEANIYTHILQRLKQDEPDCGDGITITLGSSNLAKLTSEESVQLLDDLTNIYGYTFA